ncbi:MAG TPA: NfeD family protein [Gaiellaceae bacterium]|nr:NfeD family protein [Gaiellaceae bacterium]HET8653338.1 NfeD family protein [Gaiellaceae bacterium]
MLLVLAIVVAVLWLPTGWGIALVTAAALVELGEAGFWIWLSRRRKAVTGAEALVGSRAVVVRDCRPDGQVRVDGELWRARCADGAGVGDEVVVERLDADLTLVVAKDPRN